jgi:carboxyl-terminal processing protease
MLKTVKREEIKVKNVPYYGMIDNDHGYIKFTGFRQEAATEVKDALLELKKSHPNLKGIVFDLRGNPGGLLDEAIKTVNIFTSRGQLVVSTKGKMPDWNKEYYTEGQAYDVTTPIVVLTDNGSASAAEIVSGSLQDLDRAVVVGANSFGKGLVQTTRPLPYNAQMKVTTSKYYIPSGRCIQALDYSNKDADGRPVKTPDSLKKAFKTKNGRTVYSGNGIKPDVALPRDSFPEIVNTLYEKYIIFDFASLYRSKHQNIPQSYLFKLSDADWQEFLEFIKNKEIKYSTETEDILKQLEKTSKAEKYYAAIKTEYDAMIQKLHVDKKADIEKFKPVVIEALEEEIASRYYFLKGRIETRFDDDKDMQEAIRLFKNPEEYKKILSASK